MSHDATDVLENAEPLVEQVADYLRPAAEWFHKHEGTLFQRSEAREKLGKKLDVGKSLADNIISQLVTDTEDPVIHVEQSGGLVGVVEFHEFDGAYGYINFHSRHGKQKRVVCQQCVNEATHDRSVTHASEYDPEGSFPDKASYKDLRDAIHEHYENAHDECPSDVKTGATLASGTTIGGNTAYHSGIGLQANLPANGYNISNVSSFDATSASIETITGNGKPYSTSDGSDITTYTSGTIVNSTTTVIDISGNGVLLGGIASGPNTIHSDITIDGTTQTINHIKWEDDSSNNHGVLHVPVIRFTNSLKVTFTNNGGNGGNMQIHVLE